MTVFKQSLINFHTRNHSFYTSISLKLRKSLSHNRSCRSGNLRISEVEWRIHTRSALTLESLIITDQINIYFFILCFFGSFRFLIANIRVIDMDRWAGEPSFFQNILRIFQVLLVLIYTSLMDSCASHTAPENLTSYSIATLLTGVSFLAIYVLA